MRIKLSITTDKGELTRNYDINKEDIENEDWGYRIADMVQIIEESDKFKF